MFMSNITDTTDVQWGEDHYSLPLCSKPIGITATFYRKTNIVLSCVAVFLHTGTGAHQHLFKGSMASQRQTDTSLSTGPMERQRKTVMNSSNSISAVLCDMQLHCCQKSIKITSMSPRWWTSWHVSGVHFEAVLQALSHDKYARIKWNYILEGNNAILLHHHQSVFLYTVSGKCQLKKKIPCDWPPRDNLPLL